LPLRLAIVGATGLVGSEVIAILNRERPQLAKVGLFASSARVGEFLEIEGANLPILDLAHCDFGSFDAALFCVGDELSAQYVPAARAAGCAVVDKSNTYRLDPAVPLVVAGVNEQTITADSGLVANPNCTTIVLLHALAPLKQRFGLRTVFAASYQSVSGAGRDGVTWLLNELEACFDAERFEEPAELDSASIAFNVQPGIGRLDESGRASEESKLIAETRKILALPELRVVAHAVRVPVLIGHSVAVTVELDQPANATDLATAWQATPTCQYLADALPTPLGSRRHNRVEIGRLRAEPQLVNGWSFFVCGDNLRIGAALNGWWILQAMARAGVVPLFSKAGIAP